MSRDSLESPRQHFKRNLFNYTLCIEIYSVYLVYLVYLAYLAYLAHLVYLVYLVYSYAYLLSSCYLCG